MENIQGSQYGLFMEAVRIIREMRGVTNGEYPRFAVWENVPGAFSSAKGNDFRAVLEEITESKIPMPPSGRWATSGVVRGNGIEAASTRYEYVFTSGYSFPTSLKTSSQNTIE